MRQRQPVFFHQLQRTNYSISCFLLNNNVQFTDGISDMSQETDI